MDARILGNNRVLISEYNTNTVTERDFKGNILWKKEGLPDNVLNAQRLANGHTFIAMDALMMEVDAEGKTVWTMPYNVQSAFKGADGVVTCLAGNRCIRLLPNGQETIVFQENPGRQRIQQWQLQQGLMQFRSRSGIEALAGNRILVARPMEEKVVEVDHEGKVHWSATVPNCMSVNRLSNGHTLVTCGQGEVKELDHAGRVVWEFKEGGVYCQARRR